MELVLFWIAFAVAVGIGAGAKGRNGFGWFLLSILISPLIAGFLVLVMPSLKRKTAAAPRRPCPFCAEPVLLAATLCPHCRSDLPPYEAPKPKPVTPAEKLLKGAAAGTIITLILYGAWLLSGVLHSPSPSKSVGRLQGDGLQKSVGTISGNSISVPKR